MRSDAFPGIEDVDDRWVFHLLVLVEGVTGCNLQDVFCGVKGSGEFCDGHYEGF